MKIREKVRPMVKEGAKLLASEQDMKKTVLMLKELYESLVSGGTSR